MSESAGPDETSAEAEVLYEHADDLDELVADNAPLDEDESFAIEDLTDQEWEVFVRGINE